PTRRIPAPGQGPDASMRAVRTSTDGLYFRGLGDGEGELCVLDATIDHGALIADRGLDVTACSLEVESRELTGAVALEDDSCLVAAVHEADLTHRTRLAIHPAAPTLDPSAQAQRSSSVGFPEHELAAA